MTARNRHQVSVPAWIVLEHLGERDRVGLGETAVARLAGVVVHVTDAGLVKVQAGDQGGTAGTAAGAVVELAEAQAVLCQAVEGGL